METSTQDVLLMSTDIFEIYVRDMNMEINKYKESDHEKDKLIANHLEQILFSNTAIWNIRNKYSHKEHFIE